MKKAIFQVGLVSKSPLSISDGEDLLINDDRAYIPGTSIAGAFRSYLESNDQDPLDLFGGFSDNRNIESRIYVYDSFADISAIGRRAEIKIDSARGVIKKEKNKAGTKREGVYFEPGLKFDLKLRVDNYSQEDLDMVLKCLKALDQTIIRFGGKKSSGLGVFKLESLVLSELDLTDKGDLLSYLREDYRGRDILDQLDGMILDDLYYEFDLKGSLVSPMLIGAIEDYSVGDVDSKSIQSTEDYVVPGSSFKGLLRARMKRIENYLEEDDKVDMIFGDGEDRAISRVFVNESRIENSLDHVKYNRIKIDRFTGGVLNSALMDDRPVMGDVDFKILYKATENENLDKYIVRLILLSLRDLATENIAIGGNSSIGRGRYRASSLTMTYGEDRVFADFDGNRVDNLELLEEYFN